MKVVTRAEGGVLKLARVAVGAISPGEAISLLVNPQPVPPALGPTARGLLEDTLARGLAVSFSELGGWLQEGGQRAWERGPLPPMHFTHNVVRLARWLLEVPVLEREVPPLVFSGQPSLADDVVVSMLLERLQGTGCEHALARQAALHALPFTMLTHAGRLAAALAIDEVLPFEVRALAPWVSGLRTLLSRAWASVERSKPAFERPEDLARVGRGQELVLERFLQAIDAAQERRLATFLIDVGLLVLGDLHAAPQVVAGLRTDTPLRDRTEARRRAAAPFRALGVLREWDQQHRAVRFVDDDYASAQRLIVEWGRLGETGFARARALVEGLDAIPTLAETV